MPQSLTSALAVVARKLTSPLARLTGRLFTTGKRSRSLRPSATGACPASLTIGSKTTRWCGRRHGVKNGLSRAGKRTSERRASFSQPDSSVSNRINIAKRPLVSNDRSVTLVGHSSFVDMRSAIWRRVLSTPPSSKTTSTSKGSFGAPSKYARTQNSPSSKPTTIRI